MTDEFRADLKEIKTDIKELVKQGAVHNELLKTHEARSLALQEEQKLQAQRLVPIEKHVYLMHTLGAAAAVVSTGFLVQLLVRLIF